MRPNGNWSRPPPESSIATRAEAEAMELVAYAHPDLTEARRRELSVPIVNGVLMRAVEAPQPGRRANRTARRRWTQPSCRRRNGGLKLRMIDFKRQTQAEIARESRSCTEWLIFY
jgi:hypothetical protein